MMTPALSFACTLGAFFTALVMSWRDIRTRQVLDRELACFAFLTALPGALNPPASALKPGLPLWLAQSLQLGRTAGGALLLLAVALPACLLAGRRLLGAGDILFALAAGFMLPAGSSVRMICQAFLLALPFSLFRTLGRKRSGDLPFIPFLAASAFIIRWLPSARLFF